MSLPNELLSVGLLGTGAAADTGYLIERSLRFNSTDSAYLSRTPSTAGNQQTWTFSCWVKRAKLDTIQYLLISETSFSYFSALYFDANNALASYLDGASATAITNTTVAVFRDCSAWYHLVWSVDSTQATAANRVKMYVNGVEQAYTGGSISQDDTFTINSTTTQVIGIRTFNSTYPLDAYLADVHHVDGQALDPTSFGFFDSNGIWQPKAYSGSYNTNGFHLPFSDNSTAAALGTDTSGNGNTWTVNNISVAAGAGNDSVVDVPTNGTEEDTGVGGQVRGNYCTWNPLTLVAPTTLSNGNSDVSASSDPAGNCRGTIGVSSGKWYWEVLCVQQGTNAQNTDAIGIANASSSYVIGSPSYANGETIGVALDCDNGKLFIARNNVWVSSGNPVTGANPFASSLTVGPYFPFIKTYRYSVPSYTANFGQRQFAYQAPSGFKALCTANLPAPVVTKPSKYMDIALYTGNGTTQTISGLGFSPDFAWFKSRSTSENHVLSDTVRGADRQLFSNLTNAEQTNSTYVTSFTSDGFSLGSNTGTGGNNISGTTYAAWTWDAGDSTVTNTDGSITSQVRANPSAGFSIVGGEGNTYFNGTLGHGLGVAPEFILAKDRDSTAQWYVYHKSLTTPNNYHLILNSTSAQVNFGSNLWNVTSTTIASNQGITGRRGIYYCFAPVAGYSSFGSYVGNGSATDGPFVYTGFRPRWIMIKNSTSSTDWVVFDTARSDYNLADKRLFPNSSSAESQIADRNIDIVSSGFKIRNNHSSTNTSSATYIYAAFAENPFQYARAR